MNLFLWTSSQYDSKSWSLFFNMTRRIEPFLFSNMTQRIDFQNAQGIEPLFHMIYLLFYMTRIELFFDQYDSKSRIFHKKWLKVLNTFLNLTERVEPFLHWTQRIELFFQPFDSKNWAFFLYESKIFFKFFFLIIPSHKMTPRIEPLFVSTMTQRIELFVNDSLNWSSFMNLFSIRVEFFFFWLKELNFFEYDSINRTHFFVWLTNWNFRLKKSKMKLFNFLKTQNWFFSHDSKNRTLFFQYDSTNRTFLKCDSFCKMIQRTEPLFGKITQRIGLILMTPRLEASFLNYDTIFFLKKKKMTQRIGPKFLTQRNFFLYGSKKWFFVWLKELIFCMTQRIETFFFEYDAENWNLFLWIWRRELMPFSFLPQRIETFSSLPQMIELFFFQKFYWLKELNFFFLIWLKEMKSEKKKKTQRVELVFLKYDLQNWTSSFFTSMIQRIELCVKKKLKKSKSSFSTMTQRIELFVNDS